MKVVALSINYFGAVAFARFFRDIQRDRRHRINIGWADLAGLERHFENRKPSAMRNHVGRDSGHHNATTKIGFIVLWRNGQTIQTQHGKLLLILTRVIAYPNDAGLGVPAIYGRPDIGLPLTNVLGGIDKGIPSA